jgi:hypothetical protein
MNEANGTIEFTLQPAGGPHVRVRLRQSGQRWAAEVSGDAIGLAIGTSARQALTAALEPLGKPQLGRLLADLGLLEPSVRVIELGAAAGA